MKNTIHAYVEINLDDLRSDDFYKNERKYGNDDTCIICGKPIKNLDTAKQVHLLENGCLVSTREDMQNSQGFHYVGSDCAKRLIVNFAF